MACPRLLGVIDVIIAPFALPSPPLHSGVFQFRVSFCQAKKDAHLLSLSRQTTLRDGILTQRPVQPLNPKASDVHSNSICSSVGPPAILWQPKQRHDNVKRMGVGLEAGN